MKQELDDKLVADFPNLYQQRHWSMQETCMCWGFPGDGWEPLIRRLSEKLEPLGIVAVQVKEKFGTLRFHTEWPDERFADGERVADKAIQLAMKESSMTCEECGQPGELDERAWMRTLCAACKANRWKDKGASR